MLAIDGLRRRRTYRVVERALAAGSRRDGFRLVQFSVQSNHLHLICEAKDREALSRGLQGLFIRIAKGLNRHLERAGTVFRDRYHDRILRTPSEVRNALSYVLHNAWTHQPWRRRPARQRLAGGVTAAFVDPCSSAPWFFGVEDAPRWQPRPHTWLLARGWRRAGPLRPGDLPALDHR